MRIFDFIFSFFSLLVLSPLFLILIFAVSFYAPGNVWFFQIRPGIRGRPFRMIKFRTMNDYKNEFGELLPDSERITPLGRFLRSSSLDELPELINIIKGDMSVVGPRPLLMEYLPLYSERQSKRHDVRPGLTGWAQINGRNSLSWEEKFELDVWYVENRSFWLDLKIILLTFKKVFLREGICATGEATMTKFTGSPKVDAK